VIKLDKNKNLYTRHGLHLNSKGKDLIANKVAAGIIGMLHDNKKHQEVEVIKVTDQTSNLDQEVISSVRNRKVTLSQQSAVNGDLARKNTALGIHTNPHNHGVQSIKMGERVINGFNEEKVEEISEKEDNELTNKVEECDHPSKKVDTQSIVRQTKEVQEKQNHGRRKRNMWIQRKLKAR
jgi:hypothetical protein